MGFQIKTDDKPHLEKLMKENQNAAKEIIGTFVSLMEEAIEKGWHELPQLFHRDLKFADLVKGVLHGALDLPNINPDTYDVLKEEVHPLSMLTPRKKLGGGMLYVDWRQHFRLDGNAQVNQETIERIFRSMLRYAKYLDLTELGQAMVNNQTVTWRGLGHHNVENLPFMPALRYQKYQFSDLQVGKFFDDVGYFDCGTWLDTDTDECPACQHKDIQTVGEYKVCLSCNAGFRLEAI